MAVMIEHLTKRFGSFTALDDVSLTMENGIFGLLGKNGAGKTTLMRILTTLLSPTEGTVTIDGIPADLQHAREIKGKIGYLPQETGFYPDTVLVSPTLPEHPAHQPFHPATDPGLALVQIVLHSTGSALIVDQRPVYTEVPHTIKQRLTAPEKSPIL